MAGQIDLSGIEAGTEANPIVGTTVGNYDVLDEIGRGGMGVVYLARQRGLDRHVALKALHGAAGLAEKAGEALAKESRLAGSLSHHNIVTVYEYLEEAGTPYIAMEYVPRGSLRPWIGSMSLAQLAGVLEGLLAGLAAVEPSGIVHRDLKPENVMVTADGHVKIADFGIAKATQRAGSTTITSTQTGVTVGTPAYMAPEQALGEVVGPWTDLYSVGIMAYEQLVGHIPFHEATTAMAMLMCHVRDPIVAPVDVDRRIDASLSGWVTRLLAKDAAERTRSAAHAWEELEDIAIELLGPMWRRESRLNEQPRTRIVPRRRQQAAFLSQKVTVEAGTAVDPIFVTSSLPVGRTREQPTSRLGARVAAGPTRRARATIGRGAAAALVAMLGGFGVARAAVSGGDATTNRSSAGGVTVALPDGWRQPSVAATAPGYRFKSPITARRDGRSASTMTIGFTTAASAALLPTELMPTGHATPARESVTLGGQSFFRYLTQLRGSTGAAAIYTQPTSTGVLVGICQFAASAPTTGALGCEQILSTTALAGGQALTLGQSAEYVKSMTAIVSEFDRRRDPLAARLSNAPGPVSQASRALQLRQLSTEAARSLQALHPGPSEAGYNATLVSALSGMATGYGEMASAAHAQQSARFDRGASAVRSAWSALHETLTRFASSG